jgi:hypothetical protein
MTEHNFHGGGVSSSQFATGKDDGSTRESERRGKRSRRVLCPPPPQAESTSPKHTEERMRIRARFSPFMLKPTPRRRHGCRNRPGRRPPWSWAPHGKDSLRIIDFGCTGLELSHGLNLPARSRVARVE